MRKTHYHLSFLMFIFLCLPANSACDLADYTRLRDLMVKEQIIARGIRNPAVIKAMEGVPRHLFVPSKYRAFSYGDYPLSIGEGQTISQPYIVAFMTEALELTSDDKVLEIGTGSGYQAAILVELVKEVYTIEFIPRLAKRAQKTLGELEYENIRLRIGDGYRGWPEEAPFDAIIVTCAPDKIPEALVDQLREGGRMIIPVGREGGVQKLVKVTKKAGKIKIQAVMDVRFVPMVKDDSLRDP